MLSTISPTLNKSRPSSARTARTQSHDVNQTWSNCRRIIILFKCKLTELSLPKAKSSTIAPMEQGEIHTSVIIMVDYSQKIKSISLYNSKHHIKKSLAFPATNMEGILHNTIKEAQINLCIMSVMVVVEIFMLHLLKVETVILIVGEMKPNIISGILWEIIRNCLWYFLVIFRSIHKLMISICNHRLNLWGLRRNFIELCRLFSKISRGDCLNIKRVLLLLLFRLISSKGSIQLGNLEKKIMELITDLGIFHLCIEICIYQNRMLFS